MFVTELLIVLALLQFFFFGLTVGRARGRYGVKAPAISGNPVFERYFRVQMNTMELLVLFLPALWIAGGYLAPLWLAVLGGTYLVGRMVYFMSYVRAPESRTIGFALSMLPILALLVTDLVGSVRGLIGR